MCGLNGLMHGGFSLMLMDEVMYYAVGRIRRGQCYASFRMRLQNPAVIGHKLVAEAWVTKEKGRNSIRKVS